MYTHLVSMMGSAYRSAEVGFIVQLGAIDCELGLASYGHGDAWICIRVFREMQQVVVTAWFGCGKLLQPVRSSC